MLQSWVPLQDTTTKKTPESKSSQKETAEQREHRLRALYERALSYHSNGSIEEAQSSFQTLVDELSKPTATNTTRPAKRPRIMTSSDKTSSDVSIPQWQRRLRYVALRNLAETCAARGQHRQALFAFSSALDDDRSDFIVWLGAAKAACAIGHLHIARRAYEAALSMRPYHWLALRPYRILLAAIGDSDDDVFPEHSQRTMQQSLDQIINVANLHAQSLADELKEQNEREQNEKPEVLTLKELSWTALVDAICTCFNRRILGLNPLLAGHPVQFLTPPPPIQHPDIKSDDTPVIVDSSRSSDDVIVVTDTRQLKRKQSDGAQQKQQPVDVDADVVIQKTESIQVKAQPSSTPAAVVDDDPVPAPVSVLEPLSKTTQTQQNSSALQSAVAEIVRDRNVKDADTRTGTGQNGNVTTKKTEVRRSARRANAAAIEAERRTTRTKAELIHNRQEDSDMVQALLQLCYEKSPTFVNDSNDNSTIEIDKSVSEEKGKKNMDISTTNNTDMEPRRLSTWKKIFEERAEAIAVNRCIKSFDVTSCGLAELLLRVLMELSKVKAVQYYSTLALLWLTVRERLEMEAPGSVEVSIHVVEALMVSGKKTSKQKVRRFQEAGRLLSQVRISDVTNEKERTLLSMRVAWLWGMLHDHRGEMQLSFQSAERALELARNLKSKYSQSVEVVPELGGSELSGYTWDGLETVIQERMSQMKSARDMEKAQEELNKSGSNDREGAKRTVSILAPSVRSTVRSLALDKWSPKDFCMEFPSTTEADAWETKLEAEVDLDARLKLLLNACEQADDNVGELVCFSIRLRTAVHAYAARLRMENKPAGQQDRDGDYNESSATRISDILTQIRKFVFIIKKVASDDSSHLWTSKPGLTGWSTEEAAIIMASTIVSLTEMIITMIPFAKHTSAAVELGQSQKKRRLGFTRCMLAFPRCIYVLQKCRSPNEGTATSASRGDLSDSRLTKKMLYVTSFCLRALAARGCCREEGSSGALIKLYAKHLYIRLREIASTVGKPEERKLLISLKKKDDLSKTESHVEKKKEVKSEHKKNNDHSNDDSGDESSESDSSNSSTKEDGIADPDYDWCDPRVIRHELAQCYECLHRIPELETGSGDVTTLDEERWLENACQVSKHIGMSFIGGDSSGSGSSSTIELDVCKSVYFLYRKRIFEAICRRRRDGGRAKRLREVLQKLTVDIRDRDNIDKNPKGLNLLSSEKLDEIVSDAVDSPNVDVSHDADSCVPKLEEEWSKVVMNGKDDVKMDDITDGTTNPGAGNTSKGEVVQDEKPNINDLQFSIMYFELFVLHAVSLLDTYDIEYKKQRNAERRKRPKEIAEKLQLASKDCIMAVRCRPWSVGAWTLLGRIFVEMADLALDERELCFTTFGLFNPEEVVLLGEGESIQNIFRRAEFCFGFAESLARSQWAQDASKRRAGVHVANVLGYAYDGNDDELWCGFGDDMDLFGSLGLSNKTSSRPVFEGEPHPLLESSGKVDLRSLAAIRLGSAAVKMVRLRELRYFHMHWTESAFKLNIPVNAANQFPGRINEMAEIALELIKEGLKYYDASSGVKNEDVLAEPSDKDDVMMEQGSPKKSTGIGNVSDGSKIDEKNLFRETNKPQEPEWRAGYCALSKTRWYYSLMQAKLMRKCGKSYQEFLPVFQRALDENKSLRAAQKQACDIEPLYKLHASRMKILRSVVDDGNAREILNTLEQFNFNKNKPIVVDVDDVVDADDWITVRRSAIAEDILSAMHACCEHRNGIQYAEFFFKAIYCKAVLLAEVLNDMKGAAKELSNLFRIDAAARVLDGGPDGIHRGYFYKMWNYRYTDTGMETAVETERKLVRWRSKLLGLYGALLQHSKEWRLLAAIIMRLRKKVSDDLPVDGAILDDLIDAYARGRRRSILSSMERGILTDAAAFEASFLTTWHIYCETLKLSKEARKVRLAVMREAQGGAGEERIIQSGRPRCLVAIHAALRVEHVRWRAAVEGVVVDLKELRELPESGRLGDLKPDLRALFLESLKASFQKWPDDRLQKSLERRLNELSGAEGVGRTSGGAAGANLKGEHGGGVESGTIPVG